MFVEEFADDVAIKTHQIGKKPSAVLNFMVSKCGDRRVRVSIPMTQQDITTSPITITTCAPRLAIPRKLFI